MPMETMLPLGTLGGAASSQTAQADFPQAQVSGAGNPPDTALPATGHEAQLAALLSMQAEHRFWNNRLCRACASGELTLDDMRILFAQYYLYSQSFTRYLAAFMANCEDDLHRAHLARNLWEEGGMQDPEQRHAEMFRRFLTEGLGVSLDSIEYIDAAKLFSRTYLDFCQRAHPAAASAFLAIGTEGIVSRLYGILSAGLRRAGVPDAHLAFFQVHVECDDEHARTLHDIMMSYAGMPGWLELTRESVDYALSLRHDFFESIYSHIQQQRTRALFDRIQARKSLAPAPADISRQLHCQGGPENLELLYQNIREQLGVSFAVRRVPFPGEVIDVRILRIPPGKRNERHKHPHESVFYVVQGRGRVQIDRNSMDIRSGDLAFVPRWALHQTHNTGDDALVIIAFTDFFLTDRVFIGDHLATTRRMASTDQSWLANDNNPERTT